jgi:Fic family protein
MADLERFIHGEDPSVPALARAAMAHVQFETIHPLLDGNGRLGRLLIVWMLRDAGILGQPLLYLSLYFKENRADYYRLLNEVRQRGDWEAWLEFFLEGVYRTADAAVDTANRLLAVFREDRRDVERLGRRASTGLRVFEAIRARPVATVTDVAARSGVSYPTASKRIDDLVELAILRELTGRRRDRVFAYDRYLQLLSEGTEPL